MKQHLACVPTLILLTCFAPVLYAGEEVEPTPKEQSRAPTITEIRKLSGVQYSRVLAEVLQRTVQTDKSRELTVARDPFFLPITKTTYYDDVKKKMVTITSDLAPPTDASKREALRLSQILAKEVAQESGKQPGPDEAPFDLLLAVPSRHRHSWDAAASMKKIRKAYAENPSSLAALVRLEKSLLEKELGLAKDHESTIGATAARLLQTTRSFAEDARARVLLPRHTNFGRPEACVLFLAGELAREGGDAKEAIKMHRKAIQIAPSDPFAWEAAVRLKMIPGYTPNARKEDINLLMSAYPCVWGRPCAEVSREELRSQIPALIDAIVREGADRGQTSKTEK